MNNSKKIYIYILVIVLVIIVIILSLFLQKQKTAYTVAMENQYNLAFYELTDYIDDVENYLAKATGWPRTALPLNFRRSLISSRKMLPRTTVLRPSEAQYR